MAASVVLAVTPDTANVPPRVRLDVSAPANGVARTNLATDPNMETASGTVVTRTNLFPNPTLGVDAVSWSAYFPTGTAAGVRQTGQTGWSFGVTTAYRVTWSVASSAPTGGVIANQQPGITPGRTYAAYIQARCSKLQLVQTRIDWYDAASAYLSSSFGLAGTIGANVRNNYAVSGVAPANAARASIVVDGAAGTNGSNWAVGDWLEASVAHLEETNLALDNTTAMAGAFFGSLAAGSYGPDYTYTWAGTAHASASQQRAPSLTTYQGGTGGMPVSRSTEQAVSGTGSMKIGWVFATASGAGDACNIGGLTIGATYTYTRWVWVPNGSPVVQLQVDGLAQTGTTAAKQSSTNNTWERLTYTFVATGVTHVFRVVPAAPVQRGDYCYTDAMQVETGSVATQFFTGASAAAGEYTYAWTGTANASTSQERTGSAVDVVITRTDSNNVTSTVRLAGPVVLTSGVAVVYDYEIPYGSNVTYTATSRTAAGVSISSMAVATLLAVTKPWLIHIGSPSLSLELLSIKTFGDRTRKVNQGVFEPYGRANPIVVTDGRRKSPQGQAQLRTQTLPELAKLLALLDDASVVLINIPESMRWGVTAEYWAVGDVTESREIEVGTDTYRSITAPYIVVSAPIGGSQSQRTYTTVLNEAVTYQALLSRRSTYLEVLAPTS